MYKGTFDKNSSSSCVLLVFDKNLTFSPTDFVCDVISSLNNIQFYTLVLYEFGKNEDHKRFKSPFDFWHLTVMYALTTNFFNQILLQIIMEKKI